MATIHPVRGVQSGLHYDFGSEWINQMTFEYTAASAMANLQTAGARSSRLRFLIPLRPADANSIHS